MKLGDDFPDFEVNTSMGVKKLKWHEYIDGKWAILFSHPADYTPVCTTELGTVAALKDEFDKRNCAIAALSCNDVESHKGWIEDIESQPWAKGKKVYYPIIADPDRKLAEKLGMIDPDEKNPAGLPMTCRAVFIIGPDKKLKLQILYPASTGRNFNEIVRVLDSLQLTVNHKVATPVDWKSGDKCMVLPTLSDTDAEKLFAKGFEKKSVPSGKGYIRMTPDPSDRGFSVSKLFRTA